jgi:uncharacterized protein (DUF169 family)
LGRYQGIIAAPLSRVEFEPDVVIIEDEVEKLMWIALAWLNRQGGRLDFSTAILQAMCKEKKISHEKNNLYPDCGYRVIINLPGVPSFRR